MRRLHSLLVDTEDSSSPKPVLVYRYIQIASVTVSENSSNNQNTAGNYSVDKITKLP